jgi:hypothetical protein
MKLFHVKSDITYVDSKSNKSSYPSPSFDMKLDTDLSVADFLTQSISRLNLTNAFKVNESEVWIKGVRVTTGNITDENTTIRLKLTIADK